MSKSKTVFAKGRVFWAKVVGEKALVSNYDGDGKEWTFEFEPADTAFLKGERLLDRLKDPLAYAERLEERGEDEKAKQAREFADGRTDYILLRKPEFNRDGEKNLPFRIYDENNEPWDDRLIGNGSEVDIKLNIRDWGPGKKKGIYCAALRVTNLVTYESDEFAGMDGDEPKAKKPKAKAKAAEADDTLDDDLPFDMD